MKTTILRIYMPLSAKIQGKRSLWQKLFSGGLPSYLLKKAKEQGIGQAILQRVTAGFLDHQKLAYEGSEVSPPNLPLCIELVDDESKLKRFVAENKEQLSACRCILFTGLVV